MAVKHVHCMCVHMCVFVIVLYLVDGILLRCDFIYFCVCLLLLCKAVVVVVVVAFLSHWSGILDHY